MPAFDMLRDLQVLHLNNTDLETLVIQLFYFEGLLLTETQVTLL
jgi:hypothetical protein